MNGASGWTDAGVGDVRDVHEYPGPVVPAPDGRRALVLGEFGGLGLPLADHTWLGQNNWGYRRYTTLEELGNAYRDLVVQLPVLIARGLAAAVYTQTTDVEIEVNGVMTYDRAVVKLPPDAPALHARLYEPPPAVRDLVASSRDVPREWRYTTDPPGGTWTTAGFDDRDWRSGPGGFGSADVPGARPRTPWTTGDIWLRRSVTIAGPAPEHPQLLIHHDEDAEVYLNGVRVAAVQGALSGYALVPLDAAAAAAIRIGDNTLAVHARNGRGGQYIDVGIIDVTARR